MFEENKREENETPSDGSVSSESNALTEESRLPADDRSPMESKPQKKPKKISLTAFICSAVALVLAAVMVTYACCFGIYRKKLAEGVGPSVPVSDTYYPFELFSAIFQNYGLTETDDAAMLEQALKAYVYATGDRYAAYYTEEELAVLNASSVGSSEGIGINIIQDETTVNGVTYKVLRIVNLMENSPALAAGLQLGDMIYATGIGESAETISSLGYEMAITRLQGESGTQAEFTVLRPTDEGVEILEFQIMRSAITTTSVRGEAVTYGSQKIGVVKIFEFDLTTPTQFKTEMNRLIEAGCTSFVYDVRYNPGGNLRSIEAVLSYFLEKDDVLIRTKDKSGNEEISRVKAVSYSGDYAGCSVSKKEIGMYRSYPSVVLCNESTASAGELFVATFRDYRLATVVGVTTFGKGTMQQMYDLSYYNCKGALKLTVAMYYPASGEGYDGEGIEPNETVEPSEELKKMNLYEVNVEKDNQLAKALSLLTDSQ